MADMSVAFVTAEENMSEEDEEFMLDNFVTFFIAGKCWFFFPGARNVFLFIPIH